MRRAFFTIALLSSLAAALSLGCGQNAGGKDQPSVGPGASAAAQATIDSLRTLLQALKPGLGEFMLQLKYHHDRLGEAIAGKDYERAGYETDEMKETAEKIVLLQITNDKLQQPFGVFYDKYLQSALVTLADAAAKKDDAGLKLDFVALTNNCNSCHHENKMPFMKIGDR
jgi:hypothetical protein